MATNNPSLLVYNTNLKPDDEILAEFVVRQDIYDELFDAIKTATMEQPEQHYLVVGQRGMGKTTLVNRLRIGVEQDPELKQWLMPVVLQEEQYQLTELANLWEIVADYLEGLDEIAFAGLFDHMEKNYKRTDYERFCFDLLSVRLRQSNKKVLLFIENFGEFLNKLSDIEQHRLREVLMMNNQIRLIATSSVFLATEKKRTYGQTNVEQNFGYDKPFWEFFRTVQLEGLSKTEAQTLLRALAKRYDKTEFLENILTNSPSRVEVLRRLSGGVVRTMVLLFEIFLDDEGGSALTDLNLVLDRITPLYKHRTDDLSVQQQKIIDTIARHWDSISTKEIAERTRLESKLVSAQLKQLSDNNLIQKIPTSTKNHLYQLSERFYNIWYLMRYGKRRDNSRVIWLVRFLEDWCSKEELEVRAAIHAINMISGKVAGDDVLFWSEVYLNMDVVSWDNKVFLLTLLNNSLSSAHLKYLSKTDEGLYVEAENLKQQEKYQEALELYLKITRDNEDVQKSIGYIYAKIDTIKFLDFYLELVEKGKYWAFYELALQGYKNNILQQNEAVEYFERWLDCCTFEAVKSVLFLIHIDAQNAAKIWDKIELKNSSREIRIWRAVYLLSIDIQMSLYKFKQGLSDIEDKWINILVHSYLETLLIKKQYHATYNLFQDYPDLLKERFKPIWYALMFLMKDEFPDEHLRMPAELRETVMEIVEKVTKNSESVLTPNPYANPS